MSEGMPRMRDLAVCLMAWEAKASQASVTRPTEVFLVCEKLRPHLAGLMGKPRASLPRSVRVTAEGTLDGLDEPDLRIDADKPARRSRFGTEYRDVEPRSADSQTQ